MRDLERADLPGKPFGYPGGSRPGIIFFNDEAPFSPNACLSGAPVPEHRPWC